MLHYILQIVAFQVVFLFIYDVFLKRETFFNYNRIYLLTTAVISFFIPFIKLETIQAVTPKDFVIVLPELIIGSQNIPTSLDRQVALQAGIVIEEPSMPIWQIVLMSGMVAAALLFIYKLIKLYWLRYKSPKRWNGNILIVKLLRSTMAFSFFNTIFLGEKIPETQKSSILKHELVHVKQWHSLDLILFEIIRIFMWFNPLVYMYQNRIKALHEFIADETAVKQNGKKAYYQELLNKVFETNNLSFTNTFFKKSLIKKRIVMLQKSKSKQRALFKYALLFPVIFGMLIYTSAEVKAQEKEGKVEEIIEVIDVEEISEKALIDKYYKQMKAYRDNNEFSKIMDMADFDFSKFKMSLDEYAKLKAFIKAIVVDDTQINIENGTASKSQIEILEKFKSQDKTYIDYLERTKTEAYGRKWETRTEGGILKLFVKDLKNKTREEEERLSKKMDLLANESFWKALLISDGKKAMKVLKSELDGKIKEPIEIIEETKITSIKEAFEVPYAVVENPPTFAECKDLANTTEKKKCTSNKVAMFVNKNFNTDLAVSLGLEGRQRISVGFKVNEEGYVTSIFARAPHPELEKEAKRVIGLLPKFIPGTQRGKPVTVPYGLPIIFQVQSKASDNIIKEKRTLDDDVVGSGIAFSGVDKIPTFNECQSIVSKQEKKECTSLKIAKFVNKNFNTDLASKLGLTGRQRISVEFKIGVDGRVHSSLARAPHPKLEEEALRVINALPKFIPGEHQGKKVDVQYALPIVFQLQ